MNANQALYQLSYYPRSKKQVQIDLHNNTHFIQNALEGKIQKLSQICRARIHQSLEEGVLLWAEPEGQDCLVDYHGFSRHYRHHTRNCLGITQIGWPPFCWLALQYGFGKSAAGRYVQWPQFRWSRRHLHSNASKYVKLP